MDARPLDHAQTKLLSSLGTHACTHFVLCEVFSFLEALEHGHDGCQASGPCTDQAPELTCVHPCVNRSDGAVLTSSGAPQKQEAGFYVHVHA